MQINKPVPESEGFDRIGQAFYGSRWGDIQYRLTLNWGRKLEYSEGRLLRVKLIAKGIRVLGQGVQIQRNILFQ
ncbi:hypothetical protein SAMN05216417_10583 [Nitrosospira multiformis]|uniref:Uncharacterized protein n=1 Tax=Nitrosospira multiformis TaxID=1231 RepID=A0A1I7GM32_9PROT|nr:hypothetical protein SAMN05216417_10583 [Nitrosospira multiformis]